MRQQNDMRFAEIFCRARTGECTEEDFEILRSREIEITNPSYPHGAIYVFAYNVFVDDWNNKKLSLLAPNAEDQVLIKAIRGKKDSTQQVDLDNLTSKAKRSETAGLHSFLTLAIGAQVMLVYNVDTLDGLVNGVIGTVTSIVKNITGGVSTILVQFNNENVGKRAIASSQWKQEYSTSVPITRREGMYEKTGSKGSQTTINQFPLTLAWAITIHKCQGLTLDKIVVNMHKSKSVFRQGQAYVAFSRVKSLDGLYITNFDPDGIKTNKMLSDVMREMEQNQLLMDMQPRFLTLEDEWVTVGHLNVRYLYHKIPDLLCEGEKEIYSKTDVMCFTETYLTGEQSAEDFLNEHGFIAFRDDIPDVQNHQGKHGLMICVVPRLKPQQFKVESPGLESLTVMLNNSHTPFFVTTVYRYLYINIYIYVNHLYKITPLMVFLVVNYRIYDV